MNESGCDQGTSIKAESTSFTKDRTLSEKRKKSKGIGCGLADDHIIRKNPLLRR